MAVDPLLITTAFDLPGQRVVRNLGVVRGIIVRSRSIVGNFGAAIQSREAYDRAIELAGNTAETAYLTRRRDQLG